MRPEVSGAARRATITDVAAAKPASMHDVARLAGVSTQTVSRALNGHPNVRRDTRVRVLTAAALLRFRPNRAARVLRGGRSHTLGVLAVAAARITAR